MSPAAPLVAGFLVLISVLAVHGAAGTGRRSLVLRRLAAGPPVTAPVPSGLPAWPLPPPAWLAPRLVAAGVVADSSSVWQGWLLAGAGATALAALAGGPALAAVAVVAAVTGPPAALFACSGRADRLLEGALPDLLETMARSLRSGLSLRQAVEEAAGAPGLLGHDLRLVTGEVDAGVPLLTALDGWGRRRPLPGISLAVSALGLGVETGGAHARALDGVAATLRARSAVAGEVRALSAQARLSAVVIVLAPLGFSALAAATDERTAAFFVTPLGLACLAGGLALDALAGLWMHRLSRVDQ
ncbi:MAG: type II secretion system F family protein [Actinobacteria bacterium]|nr:type II secretion system F family protein [Actinomycetota bacterium]